uniref:Immunoglobulin V-set domain-containing protein n=1 Tax=Chrysemys picta bellii TaxID=8478 RepID=A0A8C3F8F9_CHRPI
NVPFTPLLGMFLTEKFSLSGSPYPVVGIVGQDVVLPCQLSPRTWPVDTEVLWSKIEGTHSEAGYVNVHQYKNQPNLDISGDNYQRRTEMFQQEFRNGNVSLNPFAAVSRSGVVLSREYSFCLRLAFHTQTAKCDF